MPRKEKNSFEPSKYIEKLDVVTRNIHVFYGNVRVAHIYALLAALRIFYNLTTDI